MTDRTPDPHVLMLVENMSAPTDRRVWKEASSLARNGYRVSIVSPMGHGRDTAPHEDVDGIQIFRYPYREAGGGPYSYLREYGDALKNMRQIAGSIDARNHVDVVHLCNPPDVLYMAIKALRRQGVRVVFDHHDLVPELFDIRFGRAGPWHLLTKLAERKTMGIADVVIAPNESYRQIAIDRGKKSPEDVFVVRMAPDAKRFTPIEPVPELRRGKSFLIAYAGTIGPQDGVDHALEALKVLSTRRTDWHAVFAGEGDAAIGLRRMATDLGLTEHVEFVGFLDDTYLVRLLSSADICISPEPLNALNDSSTMIKVVEYMGMGRPIVAFDLRETRYSAGDAALYARPNDAAEFADCIERLLDDPELRRRMGEAGRRRMLEELTWERSEEQLLAAYERVLATPK